MAFQDCIDLFRKKAGRDVSDADIAEYLEALEAQRRWVAANKPTLTPEQQATEAAEQLAKNLEMAAIIEKRNAAMNAQKRLERVAWLQSTFGKNLALGVESMLVGTQRAKRGARLSVASVQASLEKAYFAGFTRDIEHTGHGALLASGGMDREIARALWAMDQPDMAPMMKRLPEEAVSLAKVIGKWQEIARDDANKAGAWVGKRADYIVKQTHDPIKVRGKGDDAAYANWKKTATETFDIPKMLQEHGATDLDKMLRQTWLNLASGNHLKAAPDDVVSGFKGPGNLAKRLSQSRSILFKDADAFMTYNENFGTANLRESIINGLSGNAQATGMMQVLGTNPKAMLSAIVDDLKVATRAAGDVEQSAKLTEAQGSFDRYMSAVDGAMNVPGHQMAARVSANVRSIQTMAKLGGMLLSQLNDVAVYGSGASYQGRGFFSGMGEAVSGLGRSLKPQERRDLAASLGVVLDNMIGEIGRVGSFNEAGSMTGIVNTFMKLNGAQWWTSRMRTSAAFGMSHHMALNAGNNWDSIGPEYQRVLSLYDIGPAEWDVIRQSTPTEVDGKVYITPEQIRDASDDVMRAYTGVTASDKEIAAKKRLIEDRLRTYFIDQTETLALEPDAKTKAITLQGTRPGTWTGEFMRFAMQFKSFTAAYTQRILGREIYGRGYEGDSIWGALRNGNGEMRGLANLILTSTLLGYGSMALKDVAKGKTPRDPLASPEQGAKVFLAAMLQGGGAGIYGDFLFGQANRMGSGTVEALAGPTISSAGRMLDLYHKAKEGDDVASRAMNEALANTPFANLFYTRIALNYLVLYELQESMNPGYIRRMERRAADEGQEFLISPR